MQTIREYRVVTSEYLFELVPHVNEAIAEGWQPIGGVSTWQHSEDSDVVLCQAMVRMEETILGYPTEYTELKIGTIEDIGK